MVAFSAFLFAIAALFAVIAILFLHVLRNEAIMKLYSEFKQSEIDLSCVGLGAGSESSDHFCTPVGAKVIGWAGVDGIHFCKIEAFGDMVFVVSPMNEPGTYVHPVAEPFEDFLRLIISCGDTAAIEQAHQWDRELYDQYICDNRPTQEQRKVLDQLQEKFALEPIADPFAYMEAVRKNFNYRKLQFPEDYYAWVPAEPLAPQAPEWKITFQANGTPGIPVRVNKAFHWAGIDWIIPEVYACEEGLVVLTFGKIDPAEVRKHITGEHATPEDIERMDAECPLNIHLQCKAKINGSDGVFCGGSGLAWMPSLPGEGTGDLAAKWALEHYGFDTDYAWIINRDSYRWPGGVRPELESLVLTISQRPVSLSGTHFMTPRETNTVELEHPLNCKTYTLTIENLMQEEADLQNMQSMGLEFPTHYTRMEYRIQPELGPHRFRIQDCTQSDEPRPARIIRPNGSVQVQINAEAAAIGIIGGADGPTAVCLTHPVGEGNRLRMASSSLHFEPVAEVEWRIVFLEKLHEDITVQVI